MDILPILSTLRRHKISALLVILEIALTCAIVCNAVFLITKRIERTHMPSGIAEHELVMLNIFGIGRDDNGAARASEDLALLRQIPGVKSVTLVNEVPFTNSSWNTGVSLTAEQKRSTLNATQYFGEHLIETFGLQLVEGRDFQPDEYMDFYDVQNSTKVRPAGVIITRSLAERLWPGQSALGKQMFLGDSSVRVVGVVAALIRPSIFGGDETAQWSMIFPLRMDTRYASRYVIRTAPDQRDRVIAAAAKALRGADPHRILFRKGTLDEERAKFFRNDVAMSGLLSAVCAALLIVTALGIVGLASFWVQQRTRMIGVRRALGATRSQILRYFQTENFLLSSIGIALGMLAAWGVSLALMQHYELPQLPLAYLPGGALALWLLGQLAVWGPARRASLIPPVEALRS